MLVTFIALYLLVSVGIGLYASRRVHNARDFAVAGRSLPLPIVIATVFATWFGSETVLGTSATFVKEGLGGVAADPFGASMCLILAGLFFAPLLYRMNLLTIGDYYRVRYNQKIELVMSICIMVSYLGWVAAQITALGLVFNMVSGVDKEIGMIVGIALVLLYTIYGGMWSVAVLDFVQMTVIMAGMLLIAYFISDQVGGVATVVNHAQAAGKLQFFPTGGPELWIPFIGGALTMMLGSIPQQDVFQRMTAAKNERTAVIGSVSGGVLYFVFAFVPIFLAYSATLIDPKFFNDLIEKDSQQVLPSLIMNHTPLIAQVFFFGALLSAIMSTASATLLAPSVMFTENVLKHFALKNMNDQQMLKVMRIIVLTFGSFVLIFALKSTESIYEMVGNAYKITLAGAFVPLLFGLYWKRANTQGAAFAIVLGIGSWLTLEVLNGYGNTSLNGYWPPQLVGLIFSTVGMLIGSLLPNLLAPEHHHHAK